MMLLSHPHPMSHHHPVRLYITHLGTFETPSVLIYVGMDVYICQQALQLEE